MSELSSDRPEPNRGMILFSVMLATIMTALDVTIANVALPHMAGSVSASADQITWVLTSYIVAAAIMTPMTGWLAGRLGRKRVFLASIAGFTIASALCGAAQNLQEIVVFRVLQGAFGAAMAPLSQAVILDLYSLEERGPVMAIWGMGVMVAPIAGPVLGGWLTDDFSWRWVFYINLPVGVLCCAGLLIFLHEHKHEKKLPFDIMGFALLSIAMAALQLFLDRGENKGWFDSTEIVIEATICALAFTLFAIHTATTPKPFLPVELLRDQNFLAACGLTFITGILTFSVLALLPPLTQSLLGYPVVTAGLVMAPRGIGTFATMFLAGRLVGRMDSRIILAAGLGMFALSFYGMSHFSLQMDSFGFITTGFIQGVGGGLLFMPLTTLAFATLPASLRADGAGVYSLVRNLGQSLGISIMQAMFTRNVDIVHARLVEPLHSDNPLARAPYLTAPFSLTDPAGMAALDGEVTRQASMVAYIDLFHLMFVATVLTIPLLFLMRKPTDQIVTQSEAPSH